MTKPPRNFQPVCECGNENCELLVNPENWIEADDYRNEHNLKQFIVSVDCDNIHEMIKIFGQVKLVKAKWKEE